MPRTARKKTFTAIFHVMARSISEVDLYKDNDDKKRYLSLIKKYQQLYEFKVYSYCLMDNHVHLIIDANGSDISRVMHGINFSYVQYFNKKYNRHGHLFQDRFKSKIITNERYLITVSAYIHNNPTDMIDYSTEPEKYEFSSLSVYLGLRRDPYEIVDKAFIMDLLGGTSKKAREKYLKLVYKCCDKNFNTEIEFENERTEYRSERKLLVRNYKAEDVVEFIALNMEVSKISLHMKHCRQIVRAKALIVILMRSLCNYKCSSICELLGNITQARVSKLSSIGIQLVNKDEQSRRIVEQFITCYSA